MAIGGSWWRRWGPLVAGSGVMACGLALRANTFGYDGAPTQRAFNNVISAHLGAYSDIASLYFRDRGWLWHHLVPYFHGALEYPVGTGMVAWFAGLFGGGVAGYMAVNAVVLVASGLGTIWLLRALPGANPWLFALAPALALYVVLNWDLISIAALIGAVVLFQRQRDEWAGAVLGVATWTKFFPVIALPVLLLIRWLDPGAARTRAAARLLIPFALVTVVINAPFAIGNWGHWFHFFSFNRARRGGGSLWALFDNGRIAVSTENLASTLLLVAGLVAILATIAWVRHRRLLDTRQLLTPALLASIGWLFFTIKLYSPQYDLWVVVLIAAAGAPVALAVAFAAADLAYFAASFTQFRVNSHWIEIHVIRPAIGLREAVLLAIIAWAVWSIVARGLRPPESLPVLEKPDAVPALAGAPE